MTAVDTLIDGRCFLEGIRWRADAIYVSDLRDDTVLRVRPDGTTDVVAEVDDPVGLGWLPDGRMLVVSTESRKIMRVEADGTVVEHADVSGFAPYNLNDMYVDPEGRAFVGQWGYDIWAANVEPSPAGLVRVDPNGDVSDVGGGLLISNGLAAMPDDRTLVVVETIARRISAFDLSHDGTISNQRIWAELDLTRPDGMCIDADQGVWVCDIWDNRVVRVTEGGKVTDVVELADGHRAATCALGGDDGRTLFLAVTTTGRTHRLGAREDRAGCIQATRVDVPGCERP